MLANDELLHSPSQAVVWLCFTLLSKEGCKAGEDPLLTLSELTARLSNSRSACELVYPGAPNVSHETPTDFLIATLKKDAQ